MENSLNLWKASLAAVLSALGAFLGWQGILGAVWILAMALDYLSGTLAACREGAWSSEIARNGLWHKGGMILVVAVSALADGAMALVCAGAGLDFQWPVLVLPLVLGWYILTELGSILENAVKMGASVPDFLLRLLKSGLSALEKGAR